MGKAICKDTKRFWKKCVYWVTKLHTWDFLLRDERKHRLEPPAVVTSSRRRTETFENQADQLLETSMTALRLPILDMQASAVGLRIIFPLTKWEEIGSPFSKTTDKTAPFSTHRKTKEVSWTSSSRETCKQSRIIVDWNRLCGRLTIDQIKLSR